MFTYGFLADPDVRKDTLLGSILEPNSVHNSFIFCLSMAKIAYRQQNVVGPFVVFLKDVEVSEDRRLLSFSGMYLLASSELENVPAQLSMIPWVEV